MKKIILHSVISLVALFSIPLSFNTALVVPVYAQSGAPSISGDDACGSYTGSGSNITIKRCGLTDAKNVAKNFVIKVIIPIGSAILFCFIVFRILMAQKALMEGNANAYKEAGKKIANAIFGFLIIAGVMAGFVYAMLKFLSVKPEFLQLLSDAFIPHAYAQSNSNYLPNPVGANSLYDFLLLFVRLFIRWFVYPAIVAVWVWTGFAFVAAQGAPEALAKAKKWLLWALISTILIFVSEGFLFALRGTVNQIVPESVQQQTVNTTTPIGTADGRVAPAPGAVGSACVINGTVGQIGTGGVCYPSRTGAGTGASTNCSGLAAGTICVIPTASGNRTGICGSNTDGVFGCYQAMINDVCLLPNGQQGRIGANYQCQ